MSNGAQFSTNVSANIGDDVDDASSFLTRRRDELALAAPPPPSKKKAESPQPESMPSPADGDLLLNDRIGCSAPMQIGPSRPTKGRRNLNKTQNRATVVSSERGGGKNYSNDVTRLRHLVRKFPLLLTVSADCEFAYQYCG